MLFKGIKVSVTDLILFLFLAHLKVKREALGL